MASTDLRLTGAVTETFTKGQIKCLKVNPTNDITKFHATARTLASPITSYDNSSDQGVTVKSGTVAFTDAPFCSSTDSSNPAVTVNGSYKWP